MVSKTKMILLENLITGKKYKDAQKWLTFMKYNLSEIEYVKAVKISGHKTDVQVQI